MYDMASLIYIQFKLKLSYFKFNVCQSMLHSLGSLVNLEVLNISYNRALNRVPDTVGTMQSLRILGVFKCNLTELPVRYVQLHIV